MVLWARMDVQNRCARGPGEPERGDGRGMGRGEETGDSDAVDRPLQWRVVEGVPGACVDSPWMSGSILACLFTRGRAGIRRAYGHVCAMDQQSSNSSCSPRLVLPSFDEQSQTRQTIHGCVARGKLRRVVNTEAAWNPCASGRCRQPCATSIAQSCLQLFPCAAQRTGAARRLQTSYPVVAYRCKTAC
jgi:hypothetical protein